ncbi:MAG: MFS transporter [Desulfatirhabdiaceae bacterium]
MIKNEKKILGLTAASHNLVHLYEGVLPPIIPLVMVQFSTDYFHLGIVVSIFSYAFGIGSLPAGWLSDRVAPIRLIALYLFGAGLLSVFMYPVQNIWIYGLMMGLVGLLCSIYHPASNTLISHAITEKGQAFGIHGIAGSLGVAIAPVLSAWLGSGFGWEAPHIIYGMMGILAGAFALRIHAPVRKRPVYDAANPPSRMDRIAIVRLIIFYCSAGFLGLTYKGIMTFLPVYMGEQVQLPFLSADKLTLGGTVATFTLLSGAAGQYIGGRLVDRFGPEKIYAVAIGAGALSVWGMAVTTNWMLILSAVTYAFFYFATQPVQNFMLSRYLPPHRHGIGFGAQFFITFGVGSTAAAVSGYIADHHGLPSIFYAMTGCFAVSSVLSLILIYYNRLAQNRAEDGVARS